MRPEEKLHRAIWSALDVLKQESLVTPKNESVQIDCNTDESKRAVQALKNSGAIKIINPKTKPFPLDIGFIMQIQGVEPEVIGYYVGLVEPRFTEVLNLYYETFGKNTSYVSKETIDRLTEKLEGQTGNTIKLETHSLQEISLTIKKPPQRKIEKLTLVRPSSGPTLKVIVNDDYKNILHFAINKSTGNLLSKLIEENREPINYADHSKSFSYLNKGRNQLITKTNCLPTKILESKAGYIKSVVEIESITEVMLKNRLGKGSKNI
jgi:hypothetical protein